MFSPVDFWFHSELHTAMYDRMTADKITSSPSRFLSKDFSGRGERGGKIRSFILISFHFIFFFLLFMLRGEKPAMKDGRLAKK